MLLQPVEFAGTGPDSTRAFDLDEEPPEIRRQRRIALVNPGVGSFSLAVVLRRVAIKLP
jgi:hypothetical protein